jgi:hypothetical protein
MEGANNVRQKESIPSGSAWRCPELSPWEPVLKRGHAERPFGAQGSSAAQVKV